VLRTPSADDNISVKKFYSFTTNQEMYFTSVPNLLYSSFISKNMQNKTLRPILLPAASYGCETWPLTLREKHRLGAFGNRVLRKIFGPKRNEVTGNGEDYITSSFMICTPHQT
jgi:hypothetical protein